MPRKFKALLVLLVFGLLVVGCSADKGIEGQPKLLIEEGSSEVKQVTPGETVQLKLKLADEKQENYNYQWIRLDKAGKLKAKGKKASYTAPAKPGQYKIKAVVSSASGKTVSTVKTVIVKKKRTANKLIKGSNQKITASYSPTAVVDEKFEITGEAAPEVEKIKVTVDGYELTNAETGNNWVVPNNEGEYDFTYSFNQANQDRKLVVKAYNDHSSVIDTIENSITVKKERAKLTVDLARQVKVKQEFKVEGRAAEPIDKVIISLDGWKLAEEPVTNGEYEATLKVNQTGRNRKLVVNAFKSNGVSVTEVSKKLNIFGDDLIPDVPYWYQHYNDYYPKTSCQNTSTAMVLNYYGWQGTPDDITADWNTGTGKRPEGLAKVFNHYAQQADLRARLKPHTKGSMSDINSLLAEGKPVIVHGWFTTDGHVIVLVGYDGTHYYANDPAGKWDQETGGDYYNSSWVGEYIKYHEDNMKSAIKTGETLWYNEIYFVD